MLSPRENAAVAVIFPDSVPASEAFGRVVNAGGLPMAAGRSGSIMIAWPQTPAFAEAVRKQGAWGVFASPAVVGCATDQIQ